MSNRPEFTRRDVNASLLAAAFALVGVAAVKQIATPTPLFSFAIAGGWHHHLEAVLPKLIVGEHLELRREASNTHDACAIAVHADGLKLGYIPREANEPVAKLMDSGARVTAEITRMLEIRRATEVPEDLVFTSFRAGDPMISLTAWI
jgi:HIRAN domain